MGNDGVKVGKCIPLFEYTERTIILRIDWSRKIREEIYHVKGLVNNIEWLVSCREGQYFEEYYLTILKYGLGKNIEEKLNSITITALWILLDAMTTPDLLPLLLAIKGFTTNKVDIWTGILVNNLYHGACPPVINHRSIESPYLSGYPNTILNEYGEREWEAKINDLLICKKYVSIFRLIKHVFCETAKFF